MTTARPASPRRPRSGPQRDEKVAEYAASLKTPHKRVSVQKTALPKQSEREFQGVVLDLAKRFRWTAYHTHDSRRSQRGFPDLVLVRRPRVIFAELKRQDGLVSPEQQTWIDELQACGQEAFIWRPSDLECIVGILR
jgi:hypothetical protein